MIESLREERRKMGLRLPGETTWEPILKPIEINQKQEITDEEKTRRKMISKTKIFAVVRVSKNPIHSPPVVLTPDMTSDINIGVRITCMHAPHSIPVEIWESGPDGKFLIGTIRVPVVNGIPSLASSASRPIQFTSDKPICGTLIQGTLKAVAFVEPDKLSCDTVLHDKSQMGHRYNSLKANPSSFMSIPKYIETTTEHDPNDPYYQEKLDAAHITHDPQLAKNTFHLDANLFSTKFSSMAPLMVHTELPIRAFRREQTKKQDENENIKYDDLVEETSLSFTNIINSIKRLFARRRQLSPNYIEHHQSAILSKDSAISTRLVTATKVPERQPINTNKLLIEEIKPHVFARISFGNPIELTDGRIHLVQQTTHW